MTHKHKRGKVPPQERKGTGRQKHKRERILVGKTQERKSTAVTKKHKRGRVPQQERKSNGSAKTLKRKITVRWRKNIREESVLTVPQKKKSTCGAKTQREEE